MTRQMTGAEMVIQALKDQGVDHIFGYPGGGAVLPIYDEIFQQENVKHFLVRHEQGAGHAAEGYARSTGKVGVLLVTSGPGATNAVTALADALLDSIPLVCISGQVPTALIGSDAFRNVIHLASRALAPSIIIWFAISKICRASCMKPFMLRALAVRVRLLLIFQRMCSSQRAPIKAHPISATRPITLR